MFFVVVIIFLLFLKFCIFFYYFLLLLFFYYYFLLFLLFISVGSVLVSGGRCQVVACSESPVLPGRCRTDLLKIYKRSKMKKLKRE